jgi:hypothetical protein
VKPTTTTNKSVGTVQTKSDEVKRRMRLGLGDGLNIPWNLSLPFDIETASYKGGILTESCL